MATTSRPAFSKAFVLGAGALGLLALTLGLWFRGRPDPDPQPKNPIPPPARPRPPVAGPTVPSVAGLPEAPSAEPQPPFPEEGFPEPAVSDPRVEEDLLAQALEAAKARDAGTFSALLQSLVTSGEAGQAKAAELLSAAESLFADASDQERWGMAHALGEMGGPQAMAVLGRLFDQTADSRAKEILVVALARSPGEGVNAFLLDRVNAEGSASLRSELWQVLAIRPENARLVSERLRDTGLGASERAAMLEGLVQGGEGAPAARKAVWDLYESAPALRDGLLESLVRYRDPRAVGLLMEKVRSGELPESLAAGLPALDAKTLKENSEALHVLASRDQAPVRTRLTAFQALYRVDRSRALQAVLAGFPALGEEDRLQVVRGIGMSADGGREAQAELSRIAASDPSERVRAAAGVP